MSITIYKRHNYTRRDLKYIKNTSIIEYDMSNAGINILFNKGFLKQDMVDHLNKMNKLTKNITVGKMLQKNPEWNKVMMEEFIKIRKYFMEINNLTDDDILSIKKDAMFIINKKPKNLVLSENYIFREKGTYDTYLNLKNKEFYVNIYEGKFDVKGFSKEALEVQEDHFINFIITSLVLDREDRFKMFEHIKTYRTLFLNYDLDVENYYDLDDNGYLYKYGKDSVVAVRSDFPPKNKKTCIFNNNYEYLIELINTLLV